MLAAIYVRVSTQEQHTENQLQALTQLAAARGLTVVETIQETESGSHKRRPGLDRVLALAHAGSTRVLLVWAIDRLGRSMHAVVNTVLELDRLGVEVISHQEPWLQTSGPVRPLLLSIFAWVAEQERATLIDRTNAGLARARAAGKTLGRPRVPVDLDAALKLRGQGLSIRAAALKLGLTPATLQRALVAERSKKANPTAPYFPELS
jgi:putative DNA-invertase from lambdoid prophage Rac